ncbi:glycoside hydrolase family 95 protein [Pluteus cervinus]|uniref:Glycoside hydrolase family 95 protein n=1 Tax=Pluteus cervinus TaxID=181527 RepID=A0ACD3AKJ8_9AGAR|nr:glycoside hydrolase family 95 protein [Pluteus cervinus]
MWTAGVLLALAPFIHRTISAPSGFPNTGNGLWYDKPAVVWSRDWLPIGNGYLGAMIPGGTSVETIQLNVESLWSGGPFEDPGYNGGNKVASEGRITAQAMQRLRNSIFASQNGEVESIEELASDAGAYGSYAGAGYLISSIASSGPVSNYARWLDLDEGVSRTTWTQSEGDYMRESFCSHPLHACVQRISRPPSSTAAALPNLLYVFSPTMEQGLPAPNVTCLNRNMLRIRGRATNLPNGMTYELLALFQASGPRAIVSCTQFPVAYGAPLNASLSITGASEAWVTWVGATEYSMDAGDEAHNFTFKGEDPHDTLLALLTPLAPSPTGAAPSTYSLILQNHIKDFRATLSTPFELSLGQTPQLDKPTDYLISAYSTDTGNSYLEWLLFNYGRYLLASSGRGVLPANLQGKWANGYGNAWSADANINTQMNYWSADMTNLDVSRPLFDYMQKTWAPRGAFTAQVLYNISRGWVTHNEIFGHTGMKGGGNTALWANYPESAAWMMLHVWDYFDYNHDVEWWKAQGWPLIKGVAEFQLDKLVQDIYSNDSTLVVSPCNSPEQVPITFGCAHAQQLIWQLFNAVEKGFNASGDTDTAFLAEVRSKRSQMDKGLHVGSWGQLQEWKLEKDSPSDTHRHLSHLVGLYPGYAIASYVPTTATPFNGSVAYTTNQILDAATISLTHRGNGTGPDADSGWEKVWRAAAWAQLGDATQFYHELTYAIDRNFGYNLFSLYNPYDTEPIFQIDANLAYPAVVMNALLQAPDVPSFATPLKITLLPALPKQWPSGSIRGARVRGGMTLDFSWTNGEFSSGALRVDASIIERRVQVVYAGAVLKAFTTSSGLSIAL